MRLALYLLLAALLSCQSNSMISPGNERIEPAFITDNSLIADGCEEFVRLAVSSDSSGTSSWYKPTASTLPIYHQALKTIPASSNTFERAVTIRFIETGQQVNLLCGWGTKHKIREIDILSIAKR